MLASLIKAEHEGSSVFVNEVYVYYESKMTENDRNLCCRFIPQCMILLNSNTTY